MAKEFVKGDSVSFSYKPKEYDVLIKGKGLIKEVHEDYCFISTLYGQRAIPKFAIKRLKQYVDVKPKKKKAKRTKKTKTAKQGER